MGGLPHGHPGMLKMAQEQQQQMHGRGGDDMKMVGVGGGGPSVEDRLVRVIVCAHLCFVFNLCYPILFGSVVRCHRVRETNIGHRDHHSIWKVMQNAGRMIN